MEAFSTNDVVETLMPYGVTMQGFKNWLRKGFVRPSIQGKRGTQNIFDFEDLLYVAVFKRMVDIGGGTREQVAYFLQENIGSSFAQARRDGKKLLAMTGQKTLVIGDIVKTDDGYKTVPRSPGNIDQTVICEFCNEISSGGIERGEITFLYVINIEAIANQIRTFLLKRTKGENDKTE
jgi:hypothetical protein